ncbi:hypothetical protein A3Q56_05291 [Intoshia linei]|uniref:RNA-binding protein 5 n=1 Tax=Intoshia linei TaxID=1819745 RepID=A0A177AYN9_9BILA|nr:hypothetical protein A3Q56_05291 [Intoshia linei]
MSNDIVKYLNAKRSEVEMEIKQDEYMREMNHEKYVKSPDRYIRRRSRSPVRNRRDDSVGRDRHRKKDTDRREDSSRRRRHKDPSRERSSRHHHSHKSESYRNSDSYDYSAKIVMSNLELDDDEYMIRAAMNPKYEECIYDIGIVRDPISGTNLDSESNTSNQTGESKGIAHIEFKEVEDAVRWMKSIKHNFKIESGRRVPCSYVSSFKKRNTNSAKFEWTCSRCGILNYAKDDSCYICHFVRNTLVTIEITKEGLEEVGTSACSTLIFRGLDDYSSESDLLQAIKLIISSPQHVRCRVIRDADNKSLRFAIVEYSTISDSSQILRAILNLQFQFSVSGKAVVVSYCNNTYSSMLKKYKQPEPIEKKFTYELPHPSQENIKKGAFKRYPFPNVKMYQYEPVSGFFYDTLTGLYYDSKSQYYYNSASKDYLYWDPNLMTYIPQVYAEELKKAENEKVKKSITEAMNVSMQMEEYAKEVNSQKLKDKKEGLPENEPSVGVEVTNETRDNVKEEEKPEIEITNWEKSICILCQRQFESEEKLTKHNKKSKLHKENLEKHGITPDQENSLQDFKFEYRDRAKERREKFLVTDKVAKQVQKKWQNTLNAPTAPQLQSENIYRQSKIITIPMEPLPVKNNEEAYIIPPEPLPESIGSKLLQKMGWKEGCGLGKEEQGIVEPIQATGKARMSAGLGCEEIYVNDPQANYHQNGKNITIKRFQNCQSPPNQ